MVDGSTLLCTHTQHRYAANNIISMLVRNQDIKLAPQRWSRVSSAAMAALDLVICSEQRVFDKVTEGNPGGE